MPEAPKNILITGASSGIGLVTAKYLESLGHKVFKTGRRQLRKIDCVAFEAFERDSYLSCDLKDFEQINVLYEAAKAYLGSIDVLINNAGEYLHCPLEKMEQEAILGLVNLNLIAPYYLTKLVVKGMKVRDWGRIINIGSISGVVGEANASLYAATKAALTGMARSLGLELAQNGITVNTINPGWVQTSMTETDESVELDVVPQKRFIEPIEVAKMIEYLTSDGAKGVTGQSINLCAGLSVGC